MPIVWLVLMSAALLGAAVYAQIRIPRFTARPANVRFTRSVLAVVGVASGYVSAQVYSTDGVEALLAFVSGFGAVHVPAAFILLMKQARGAGQT